MNVLSDLEMELTVEFLFGYFAIIESVQKILHSLSIESSSILQLRTYKKHIMLVVATVPRPQNPNKIV